MFVAVSWKSGWNGDSHFVLIKIQNTFPKIQREWHSQANLYFLNTRTAVTKRPSAQEKNPKFQVKDSIKYAHLYQIILRKERIIKMKYFHLFTKSFQVYLVLVSSYIQIQLSTKNKITILGVLSFLFMHVCSHAERNNIFALKLNLSLVQFYI